MTITLHRPSPPLNNYIKCFWHSDERLPASGLKILPTPSLHLMINFGDAYEVYGTSPSESLATCGESWSVGLWDAHHSMNTPTSLQILNVSFKPGGAYPFLQLPLAELQNQIVALDAIWGTFAAEVRERLYAEPTLAARFALLEKLLLARLGDRPFHFDVVQVAVATIAQQQGNLSMTALSERLNISPKHLITQFKQIVGSTPKTLARIYRFHHVLRNIDPRQPVDWTWIAHQAHYYDQAHFNKEFAAFTGHSPTEYLQLRRQLHTHNPQLAQNPHHLPTG